MEESQLGRMAVSYGLVDENQLAAALAVAVAAAVGMAAIYWVIDPKLRATSEEYESRQADYVADLDRKMRWEGES